VKSLEVSIKENLFFIRTDPSILEHVLINILMNAIQSMDKKDSFIRISIYQKDSWQDRTIIEVKDNGRGIPKKNMEKLFTPFHTTKKGKGMGMGLGLFLCKNMIEVLGGRIEVQSEVGQGTTVRVILPEQDNETEK
jgi:signal transduction histidine kinase